MGQILLPEKIIFSKQSATVFRLGAGSVVNINGQQYRVASNMDKTIGAPGANTIQYCYAIVQATTKLFMLDYSSMPPSAYRAVNANTAGAKLIGSFMADESNQIGNLINISGIPVMDWQNYVPGTSWVSGVGSGKQGKYRLIGSNLECQVYLPITGAVTNTDLLIDVPAGFAFDSSKFAYSSVGCRVGDGFLYDSGSARKSCECLFEDSNSIRVSYDLATSLNATYPSAAAPWTWANGDNVNVRFTVPLSGITNTPLEDL